MEIFEPIFSHLGERQANWRLPRTGLPIFIINLARSIDYMSQHADN